MMPVMSRMLVMPPLPGGGIARAGWPAAGHAVVGVGREAWRCQERQKACSQTRGEKLENGHDRDTLSRVPLIPVKSP
jgi:hypothetical protein